jgi:hypothetical protein
VCSVGGAFGLAVLATLSTTRTGHLLATGSGRADALTGGYHLAWIVSAGIAVVSLAIATPLLRTVRLGEHSADADADVEVVAVEPAYAEAA